MTAEEAEAALKDAMAAFGVPKINQSTSTDEENQTPEGKPRRKLKKKKPCVPSYFCDSKFIFSLIFFIMFFFLILNFEFPALVMVITHVTPLILQLSNQSRPRKSQPKEDTREKIELETKRREKHWDLLK